MDIDLKVIGIGSAHGDDQIGHIVCDRLAQREIDRLNCVKARTPIELIDHLESAQAVHLVDAAAELPESVMRLSCSNASDKLKIEKIPHRGTHDFGVTAALELATALGRRTDHVVIWLVSGIEFDPLSPVSEHAELAIDECVDAIHTEVTSARIISR